MTAAAKKILEEALALAQQEREELVAELSRSLDPVELSPEWHSEIARRVERIEADSAVFHDAEEHLQKLHAKYRG